MNLRFFDSWEAAMEAERKAREKVDALVKPTQAIIKPGQYFINMGFPDFPIFGEILDYKTLGRNEEEQEYINETYKQPHMKNYRPTKCYSVACPYGEIGDIHISVISAVIDEELFHYYKKHGWTKPCGDPLDP